MDIFLKYRNLQVVSVLFNSLTIHNKLFDIRGIKLQRVDGVLFVMVGRSTKVGNGIVFDSTSSIGINIFRHILEKFAGERLIIVSNVTPQCNILSNVSHESIEIIRSDMFMFEKYQSRLMPTYVKLNENDIIAIMKKLCITRTQFSKIKLNDPAVYILGLKVGDVVQINNQQKWRVVVD